MIGSTVSSRSAFLARKPVRVAISAKATPSAVAAVAVVVASISVFQNTPQLTLAVTQDRPQILRSATRSTSAAGQARASRGVNICDSIVSTGQPVKMMIDPASSPTAPATKRSPLNRPRRASPSVNRNRKPVVARAPPRPMPNWRSPSSPKACSSHGQDQPCTPIANPCRTIAASPSPPPASSSPARRVIAPGTATASAAMTGQNQKRPCAMACHRAEDASGSASPNANSPRGVTPSCCMCHGRTSVPRAASSNGSRAVGRRMAVLVSAAGSRSRGPSVRGCGVASRCCRTPRNRSSPGGWSRGRGCAHRPSHPDAPAHATG